ncbi:right-handed parallel beta-helix repeat-containing protein [bacterium]|nr:right-handed parallel beta-helix repeat-containing protein [bacterium]
MQICKIMIIEFLFLTFLLTFDTLSAQTEVSGEVWGVWDPEASPYLVTGELHVPTDSCLRIMPGCSVIFQGHYKFCVDNNAIFRAIGNETDSIVFTAIDTHLTDSTGGHHGIRFYTAADGCSLMYCKIKYGNAIGEYRDNTGGGIFARNTDLIEISYNKIINNKGRYGGGIILYGTNSRIFQNYISNNRAQYGGGISIEDHSEAIVSNNTITNNYVTGEGGGIFVGYSNNHIKNNVIVGNEAHLNGGAICLYESDAKIINNLISVNYAHYDAGGVRIGEHSEPEIVNNTICYNSARFDGGGLHISDNRNRYLLLFNNIIFGNSGSEANEIFVYACSIYVCYTNVDSNECKTDPLYGGTIIYGPGNINSDPIFSDSSLRLSEGSPCTNAGAESVYISLWDTVLYAPDEDFEGDLRPQDNFWDMGADEYNPEYIEELLQKPDKFYVSVYPNPFNSSCRIETQLNSVIEIYDIKGGMVDHINPIHNPCSIGNNWKYTWVPSQTLSSGIYFIKIETTSQFIKKKVIYLN